MPAPAPEPLRRTTLNLFEADCRAMERLYGRGWTERVREMVREHIRTMTKHQNTMYGGSDDPEDYLDHLGQG